LAIFNFALSDAHGCSRDAEEIRVSNSGHTPGYTGI
jgi:hypothetical protein